MEKSFYGLRPKANFLLNYMYNNQNLCDKEYTHEHYTYKTFDLNSDFMITPETITGKRIFYKIEEFENLIDSSNMNFDYWKKIGRAINKSYYQYDAFIVLHGTDTMNYTASILSFMLENLNKLVILTGSQIPLIEMRNDAIKNLIDALTIAGTYDIPEVCLLFDSKLFRGNRTIKNDNINLNAFESPNLSPLITIGINMKINWEMIKHKTTERFNYFEVKNFVYI
jgi:lysophospholipase